jgi:hypothetical protein
VIDVFEQRRDRAGCMPPMALDHLDHPALERQLLGMQRANQLEPLLVLRGIELVSEHSELGLDRFDLLGDPDLQAQ